MATVYDQAGKPTEIPDSQLQDALTSGQYGLPAGSQVPVSWDGELGTVPIEKFQDAVDGGAEVVSQADYAEAQRQAALQQDYGDFLHGAESFGIGALKEASLGASDFLVGRLGDEETKQSYRDIQEANPNANEAGRIFGIAAPIAADLATGGLATPELAAAEAARSGVSTARRVAEAANLPFNIVSKVGDVAKAGIRAVIGDEAESLGGQILQKGLAEAGKTAAEGALYSGGQTLGEESINEDPDLFGEKFMHSVGLGAIMGGDLGLGVGAYGKLLSAGISEIRREFAPEIAEKANSLLLDHLGISEDSDLSKKLADLADTPERAASNLREKLVGEGVISPGDTVEQTAIRARAARIGADEKLNDDYIRLDGELSRHPDASVQAMGPKISNLDEVIDNALPSSNFPGEKNPLGDNAADNMKAYIREKFDLRSQKIPVGYMGDLRDAAAAHIARQVGEASERITFGQAAQFSNELLEKMKTATGPTYDALERLQNGVSKMMESDAANVSQELWLAPLSEENLDKIEGMTPEQRDAAIESMEQHLPKARAAHEQFQKNLYTAKQMQLADEAATKVADKRAASGSHGVEEAIKHTIGHIGGVIGGGLLGHLAGHATFGAAPFAYAMGKKIVEERGKSTAVSALDKIATMGFVQKEVERQTAKVKKAVDSVFPAHLKSGGMDVDSFMEGVSSKSETNYERARDNAIRAAANAEPTLKVLQAQGISQHMPKMAAAFEKATLQSIAYLVQQIPQKSTAQDPLFPNAGDFAPTDQQQQEFLHKYNAVVNPVGVIKNVARGVAVPDEVDAFKATSPALYADVSQALQVKASKVTKMPPYAKVTNLKMFLGQHDQDSFVYDTGLQKNFVAPPPPPPSGGGAAARLSRPLQEFSEAHALSGQKSASKSGSIF